LIPGIVAQWPGGEETSLVDLASDSAAILLPAKANFYDKGEYIRHTFRSQAFEFSCRGIVERQDEEILLVRFENHDKAKDMIDLFLNVGLIGECLFRVKPTFYGLNQDFNLWLHAPGDTNIFIWRYADKVWRFTIELKGQVLDWVNGKYRCGASRNHLSSPLEDYVQYVIYESEKRPLPNPELLVKAKEMLMASSIEDPLFLEVRSIMEGADLQE
jgi:hypothetical protein